MHTYWLIVWPMPNRFDGLMADGSRFFRGTQHHNLREMSRRDVRLASNNLVYKRADLSCSSKVRHGSSLIVLSVLAGSFGLLEPLLFVLGFSAFTMGGFTVLIAMRAALLLRGVLCRLGNDQIDTGQQSGASEDWPAYSVLVPLYKEAGSIPKLCRGLKGLDYPIDKLEVIFLLEEDDSQTLEALSAIDLPAHWPILALPDGQPRTKPRALNVALGVLTGEIATIYDAEDYPHPDQLKAAVRALRAGGTQLACVQAPLKAYNGEASWLAGQWALEYDTHFGLILPALAKADRPIALGGTSNHFRVSALLEAKGWDAWNVTEDADLGLRFARLGYRIGTIAPPTLEEAPEALSVWVPQRSRWIKGYMQSAGVILRRPGLALQQMGAGRFLASQVLLGGAILSAVLHGPFALYCVLCVLFPGLALSQACLCLLLAGLFVNAAGSLLAPGKKGLRRLFLVVSLPLYWPLQSLGAMRALYELATDPHIWSKTPHALTQSDLSPTGVVHIL